MCKDYTAVFFPHEKSKFKTNYNLLKIKVNHLQPKSQCVKLFYVVLYMVNTSTLKYSKPVSFFLFAVCVIVSSKLCIFLSDSHFQGHACSVAPCGYGQV